MRQATDQELRSCIRALLNMVRVEKLTADELEFLKLVNEILRGGTQ